MQKTALFSGLLIATTSPSLAHHASDETIVEALLDHAVDNWPITLAVAILLAGLTVWRWRRVRS